MMLMIFSAMMIFLIMTILVLLLNMVSKKAFLDREKSSPFECGFDPKNNARLPFSLQFFLIGMIFLIFDVEITLLLPLIKSMMNSNIMMFTSVSNLFIAILILGLIHEWIQGALNWKN